MTNKSRNPASARQGNQPKTSVIVAVADDARNEARNTTGLDAWGAPPGEPLKNVRHERFAALVVALGSQCAAYAQAYGKPASTNSVIEAASGLAARPEVRARINDYRTLAIAVSTRTLEERIAELEEQIDAEPLSVVRVFACRSCYAKPPNATQWRDADEFADACEAWQRSLATPGSKPMRRPLYGGVGFNPRAAVNSECEQCLGAGVRVVVHQDHTTLSAGQRGRVEAVTQKADGTIEIDQASRHAARRLLHELKGELVKRSQVDARLAVAVAGVDTSPEGIMELVRRTRPPVSQQ
jgi:hypothetical protein